MKRTLNDAECIPNINAREILTLKLAFQMALKNMIPFEVTAVGEQVLRCLPFLRADEAAMFVEIAEEALKYRRKINRYTPVDCAELLWKITGGN